MGIFSESLRLRELSDEAEHRLFRLCQVFDVEREKVHDIQVRRGDGPGLNRLEARVLMADDQRPTEEIEWRAVTTSEIALAERLGL